MEKVNELRDYLLNSEKYHYGLIMLVDRIADAVTVRCLEGNDVEKNLKEHYRLLKDTFDCMRERDDIFMDENAYKLPKKIRKMKREIFHMPENLEDIARKNTIFDEIVEILYNSALFCRLTSYRLSLLEVAYHV